MCNWRSERRVTASRAQLGIARSNQFPAPSFTPVQASAAESGPMKTSSPTFFSLAGDVVFQLDLFGRYAIDARPKQPGLNFSGTKDVQQTVTLTLVSDVASDYFLLRDLDLQLQITKNTVRTQEDSHLKLTQVAPPAR